MTRLAPLLRRLLVALPLVLSFALLSQYFSRAKSAAVPNSAPSGQQQIATQRTSPNALQGAKAVEQLKQQGLYVSLNESLTAARYGIKPVPEEQRSLDGPNYVANNPAQQLRTTFAAEGPELRSTTESGKSWRLGIKLRSAGYGERQIEVGSGALTVAGQHIGYQRPVGMPHAKLEFASLPIFQSAIGNRQSAITEWYINKPTGLEQGFTLAEQPGERHALEPLRLTLALESALRARAVAAGQAVEFENAAGNIVLRYDHLVVRDACGQTLDARMSVKDKELRLEVDDATATYPVTIDPTFTQQAYLKASNTEASDLFGQAVAMSGDTVVVGAILESSNATGVNGNQANNSATAAGAVYVFVRSGTTWSQQAYLKASNSEASDRFGLSVAVAGNTVVVGAIGEDSNAIGVNGNQADNSASASGAAYVFVRSGTTWSQQAYLKASNTGSGDNFGLSVATAGDTVVVGGNGEDSNAIGVNGNQADNSASNAGAAYVFVRSGTTWSQQAYLKASNSEAGDEFGGSVAIAGDTVVAGAAREDSNATGVNGNQADNSATSAGAAYVFVRSGTTWSQQAYFKASNSGAGDLFGLSVAMVRDTAVVGAVFEDSNATGVSGNQADNSAADSGAAYVFVRSGTTWSQQAYLKASNTGAFDQFGSSVAMSGDTLVVGALLEDSNAIGVDGNQADNSAADSGAAYVFGRSGTTWSQQAYLKASNSGEGDNFGYSIAVDGDTVVVGAYFEASNAIGVNGNQSDNSAEFSGAVYVISIPRTFVTNGNDSGPGSLRQALLDTPAGGTIDFDPAFFNAARTITLNGTSLDINQSLTIQGPGANLLTISGNYQSRVFQISSGLTVSLSGMTIAGGNPGGLPGGGIRNGGSNLTVSACHITGNTADDGGGILSDGPLTILNSTVSNNRATLNGNAAGGVSAQSTFTLTNSTISGNYAIIGNSNGGGIWVNGNATITNSTITNNATAGANSGSGIFRNAGTTTVLNTIIAGNLNNSNGADVSAAGSIGINSSGYNLIGNPGAITFGATGDQNGTSGTPLNPQLGPLSLNGGSTPTHALRGSSLALDKGNAAGLDQRGLARQFNIASIVLAPGGNESDIGAVEMQALIVTTEIDPGDGVCDGTCSLRDAITAANGNGTGLDDIIFSNTVGATINLLSALPNITSSVSLSGPGAHLLKVRRNATPEFRLFTIQNTGLNIAISGMTISDGLRTSTAGDGGGGSGIFSQSNLTLTNVAVTNNLNRIGVGGGVALVNADGLLANCTFSANTAGDATTGGRGGAIFFEGDNGHKLRLVNSTVSGNNAIKSEFSGGGLGGGIFNLTASGNSILEVVNSTVANNTAFADGGLRTETAGSGTSQTTVRNSIVANNTANNLAAGGVATIKSQGFNLTSDNSNTFLDLATDKTNTNPLLGALANNGGPTQTHGLLTGSPALDAGHSSGATSDQRGSSFARLVDLTGINNIGDGADIGAYEAQSVPTEIQFSASNYNAGEAAGNVTITVTRTGSTVAASMVDFATGNNAYLPCNQFSGSAVQNCDFIGTSGTLTFAAGDSSKTFEVLVTDDAWLEGNETLPVTLSNPVGAILGSSAGANVTIIDNEATGITSPVAKQFVANLTGDQETPANNSTGKGGGVVLLNGPETSAQVSLIFSGLASAQTTAKIHGPAAAGVSAPPLFTLPNGTVTNAVINPTTQQVTDLKAGLHYLNVSSANFTNGEIRGQLLWNPLEEAQFFVLQHYYDFLQRLPDPGGYAFWQGQITFCNSDVQCLRNQHLTVSNAFFYEQEYQQTGAYVFRLYRAAYGNHQPFPNPDSSNQTESNKLPSYAVFAADRARVVGGANLAQGQLDLANTFVTRPEFLAKYAAGLTGPQFVDAVLATLQTELGVNLATERSNLINLFNSGGRGAVMYRLADDNAQNPINNHAFLDEEYNRAFVATQYFGYLRRDADIGGFLFWLGQVNSGPLRDVNKQHAMVCSFNTSGEYQLRFGPIITRFNSECQ